MRRSWWQLVGGGVVFVVVLAAVFWPFGSAPEAVTCVTPGPELQISGRELKRRVIYESPQNPGYTSWVGAWTSPGGELESALVQATGPVDPAARPSAPRKVKKALGLEGIPPDRDFWGLDLVVKQIRPSGREEPWRAVRSDSFRAVQAQAYSAQATTELPDGTLLRRVNGSDLRFDPSVPHTAFLQRLEPGASNWSRPQVLLDPERYTYQITRLRFLRDGRLIATGNVWQVPTSAPPSELRPEESSFLLMVSEDNGETWKNGLTIPGSVGYLPGNEWDTAELPDGNLIAVMRTATAVGNSTPARKQALLRKEGEGWVMTCVRKAPFPPSGHPELLATREGVILDVATSGITYTSGFGRPWRTLRFDRDQPYRSAYYPRSVQLVGGEVRVIGHDGFDDAYGERDQAVVMDSFRLRRQSAMEPAP